MNKLTIGLLFILAGTMYGSLALDGIYKRTLGYLLDNGWLKPPDAKNLGPSLLGRKPTILLYSLILILTGLFIIWSPLT